MKLSVAAAKLKRALLRAYRSKARRDALWAGLFAAAGVALFVQFDSAERISSALLKWERLELDDLLLGSFLAVLVSGWFAFRRWADARRYVQRLEELSTQLLGAEQHERARLAELLHDEVGQTLFACRLQIERARASASEPATRELLSEAHELAGAAMTRTRELTVDLSPPVLHDLGLTEALAWLLRRTEERFGLRTRLETSAVWQRIPAAWQPAVFHSVRELVVNAAKHARANELVVSAADSGQGRLLVRVHDDGQGFSMTPAARHGFGLFSIERRMAWFGAALEIESSPTTGTVVTLSLPA